MIQFSLEKKQSTRVSSEMIMASRCTFKIYQHARHAEIKVQQMMTLAKLIRRMLLYVDTFLL